MNSFLVAVAAFAAMEPVAAGAHRLLMHGPGWGWHRSHHRGRLDPFGARGTPGARRRAGGAFERNDLFPVCFALATVAVMAAAWVTSTGAVLAAGAGVTAYGVVYTAVHDVCVHGRLRRGRPFVAGRWLRWVAASHAVHHRTGAAPYGFLVPIVPARHRPAVISLRPVPTRARLEKTS